MIKLITMSLKELLNFKVMGDSGDSGGWDGEFGPEIPKPKGIWWWIWLIFLILMLIYLN